ncbi:murein transglycosylase A [Fluviispira multicolorata]|nr:MltA domain-containing protein [Fluviispira multicolorata]
MLFQKYVPPLLFISFLISSCRSPSKSFLFDDFTFKKESWDNVPLSETLIKKDSLISSIENNIQWLNNKKSNSIFQLKDIKFSTQDYICSSTNLLNDIKRDKILLTSLKNNFDVYKLAIEDDKNVLYTGYYIPYAEASDKPSKTYKTPVYKMPKDLITVDLEDFNPNYKGKRIRGRVEKNQLKPYWTREEITSKKKLDNKNLEIAWVKNKVDLFFIEIQGSGLLIYPNGDRKYIHYSSQNGREYNPIGALLFKEGHLDKSKITMQSIRKWLDDNPKEKNRILNYNKSYVFFSLEDDGPFGNINVRLIPERSIAADQRILPAGTLTLLDFKMPATFNTLTNIQNLPDEKFNQLAFVQDTGGAIKGPHRIDVFWGEGHKAGEIAGATQQQGEMYVLIPKNPCLPLLAHD